MKEFCEKDAGLEIRRTVLVDGFRVPSGLGCWGICEEALLERGFAFVEGQRVDKIWRSSPESFHVPGPGVYRFVLQKEGHPNCQSSANQDAKAQERGLCVAAYPIPEFTLPYVVHSESETMVKVRGTETPWITRDISQVIDTRDGSVLAEQRDYKVRTNATAYLVLPIPPVAFGSPGATLACEDVGIPVPSLDATEVTRAR